MYMYGDRGGKGTGHGNKNLNERLTTKTKLKAVKKLTPRLSTETIENETRIHNDNKQNFQGTDSEMVYRRDYNDVQRVAMYKI